MGSKAARLDAHGFQTAKSSLEVHWLAARPVLPAWLHPPCGALQGVGAQGWEDTGKVASRPGQSVGRALPTGSDGISGDLSEVSLFALQPKNPCCSTRAGSSLCLASHFLPLRQAHMSPDVAFFSLPSITLSPPPTAATSLLVRLKERSKMV